MGKSPFVSRLSTVFCLLPVLFLEFPVLQGCVTSGRDGAIPGAGGSAGVRLVLAPAALARGEAASVPVLDSVHIRVTAEDMAPMDFAYSGGPLAVQLEGLPPGENRIIEAFLFRSGKLLYAGRGSFAFRRESRAEASLRCDPRFSRVIARFHIPVGMSAPVTTGLLKLSGSAGLFSAPLRVRDEFGSFLVDEIPGDARYDVSMTLSDSLGKVRYQADRTGVFLPLGEEARWDMALAPSEAAAGVSLSLGIPKEAVLEAGFPSRRRKPTRAGELIVSEFYAAPGEKDSASQGEWFEVFNRSADSLSLGGCRLSRDRGTGATKSYAFDSAWTVPPGKALVFGRPSSRADGHYAEFSLVNTASSLLLLCGGDSALVDSLRYSSSPADSGALPMREGMVTSLGAADMSRRGSAAGWCLTKMGEAVPGGGGPGFASPGRVEACGKED